MIIRPTIQIDAALKYVPVNHAHVAGVDVDGSTVADSRVSRAAHGVNALEKTTITHEQSQERIKLQCGGGHWRQTPVDKNTSQT